MEPGMHDRLLELVADALACHGYATTRHAALEGRSGTVYAVPLLAEGPLGAIIIDVQSDDPLPAAAVGDMADVLHDVGADVALLCHPGSVEAGAAADGVSLWSFDHLIHFIGEALVCDAWDVVPQPLAFESPTEPMAAPAESLSEILPAAFLDAPTTGAGHDAAPAESFGFDLDMLEQMAFDAPEPGAVADRPALTADAWSLEGTSFAPQAAATPHTTPAGSVPSAPSAALGGFASRHEEPVDPAPRHAHPLLPIRVTPDEARMRARRLLVADSIQMVLQPVHLIDYECDLLAEGSLRYDTISGRVQVHGTDKAVSEVDAMAVDPQGFTRLPDVPRLASHERTLRVSDERAAERAATHLLDAHTRIVGIEVDDPDLGFAYTEKKKVAPRPDHIRLNPLGVFHRVLWRLVGTAGHVDVDALTGEVVEEVLHNPRHDTLIID